MKLSIAEALYLIAMDDEEGRLVATSEKTIIPGLISAIVFELYITKKLKIKNGILGPKETSGTGNIILDGLLKKLKPGMGLIDQVKTLQASEKGLLGDLDNLLIQRGIFKKEATKLLWIPLSERMENANYAFEKEIRNILRAIVFKSANPTPSFVVLMSLVYDCHLLNEVFQGEDEFIDAEKVAKDIVDSNIVDQVISEGLKEIRAYLVKS